MKIKIFFLIIISDPGTGGARGFDLADQYPFPTRESRLCPPITADLSKVFHLPASLIICDAYAIHKL